MGSLRKLIAVTILAMLGIGAVPMTATAADPVPPFIPPDAHWLDVVNYYRSMAGLPSVVENTSWSLGAFSHSCYMLYNGISHDEVPGKPGYTTGGDEAGNNGNVAVSSVYGASNRSHVELWMTGPFHAIGILRHNLTAVGYGKCDNNSTSPWKSGATLNVLSGLVSRPRPSTPILFPGNGTTTNLDRFVTESPNPMTFCGWTGQAGLPVIAMMPEPVTSLRTSMVGPYGPVQTCGLFAGNTNGVARDILNGDNAVTIMPRDRLAPGTYTVTVTTQARTVTWSFTVDPTAATGVMPISTVSPAGPESQFTPVTPFRFADSRANQRITSLRAGVPKRIKMAGTAGLPSDITAISANFTAVDPRGGGYLTVYNCSPTPPLAATLNYVTWESVGAAGVFPLGGTDLCVFSYADIDLVIDVNGYFRPSSTDGYLPMKPQPVVDTTTGLGGSGRRAARTVMKVMLAGGQGVVPAEATAVAVNIAGINPSAHGYVTAWPCDAPSRPVVANLNPVPGRIIQNFAIVPLSKSGELCLFNWTDIDLKVDVLGWFADTDQSSIVPVTPTRVTDTRDRYRAEMNFDLDGSKLPANTTIELPLAGQRNIPADVEALALTLTAVDPTKSGAITIWGCGSMPKVRSIYYPKARNVGNSVMVDVSPTGSICVRSTTAIHVVIDVTGYWN